MICNTKDRKLAFDDKRKRLRSKYGISGNKVIRGFSQITLGRDRIIYTKHSAYHREDGPAIEHKDGSKEYYRDGVLHRDNGPAIEWSDGAKWYYKNGKKHRDGGPAIENKTGKSEWWTKGKYISPANFAKLKQQGGIN